MSHVKHSATGEARLKKVRSDSVLHALPEGKQLEIIQRLATVSGEAVSRELREESPPIVISSAAIYRFAAHWRAQQRFYAVQGQREAVLAQMAADGPQMTPEKLEAWADVLFLQTAVAKDDLTGYTKLRAVMERARQTKLDARRLAMLEEKEAKLAAVEQALKDRKAGGGLTPESLEMMESMLGMIQS
ncbi:MAG: hypothetical protein JWM59_1554 [Verrucomicrobiales bacterium]|nr:hypothetical protein [Verrucomicrobiales bacterium]